MAEQSVVHSTFVVERSYAKAPEVVFDAFADPAKKRRWFGEGEHHTLEEFRMDFREGGSDLARYRFGENTPFPGVELKNAETYEDIVENRRIVMASTMVMGGRRISASLVTVEFLPAAGGTDLVCTFQGAFFEGSDGPQIREAGWKSLFDKLGKELGAA